MAAQLQLPVRWILAGLLAGLAIGLIVFLGIPQPELDSSAGQQPIAEQETGGLAVGQQAPSFAAETVQGDQLTLDDYQGKIVMLNFWATWCGPCLIEMPHLQERYERYRQDGFVVLAINFDEARQVVETYGQEQGLSFPLLLDPGGDIQELYRVRGYPSTYLLNEQGVIQDIHIGLMSEQRIDEMLASVGLEGS